MDGSDKPYDEHVCVYDLVGCLWCGEEDAPRNMVHGEDGCHVEKMVEIASACLRCVVVWISNGDGNST